jgi:hypothetical protein
MRSRFEYEAPNLLMKAALTLKAPHRWRSRLRPWVFDKKSGVRFQLAEDEDAALRPLTSRMKNGGTPSEVTTAIRSRGRRDHGSPVWLLFRVEPISQANDGRVE